MSGQKLSTQRKFFGNFLKLYFFISIDIQPSKIYNKTTMRWYFDSGYFPT